MIATSMTVTLDELCQYEQIETSMIVEIVEYGIAEPLKGESVSDWVFDSTSTHWIKKAVRISNDLDMDWVAVAMVIDLLKEKEALENENRRYKHQLRRFIDAEYKSQP